MIKKIILSFLILAALAGLYTWYIYNIPKHIVGAKAPDFQAVMSDGSNLKLSDLRGQYVLLQFWGSWCGPCRKENPELVNLYQRFGGKGFEIISVGIEQKADRWQAAILKDNMNWKYHTIELGNFSGPIGKLYGVLQIPNIWLIDPNGLIIGTNVEPHKMETLLAEKLK
jgi:thiol-disulfide isomerase/thioredoxin